MAGRKVVPDFYTISETSSNSAAELDAACTRFTQDTKVFAVISDLVVDEAFLACLERTGTPAFFPRALFLDDVALGKHPRTLLVAAPDLSRFARGWVAGLQGQGYFAGDGVKVGLIRPDTPSFDRAAERHLKPALAAIGVRVEIERELPPVSGTSLGDIAAEIANASLAFRSAGVTHVLIESESAAYPLLFMQYAESQGYRPRYGLSTQSLTSALEAAASPNQLFGVVAVGWQPLADVSSGETSAAFARCLAVLAKGGRTPRGRTQELVAGSACEGSAFLQHLGDSAGSLSPDALLAASRTAPPYSSALTFQVDLTRRRDGAAAYRGYAYTRSCSCFAYRTPQRSLG